MISICIPVYNFEVEPLINELHRQGLKSNKAFEIIVLDDDSKDFFKQKNRAVKSLENVRYEELPQNVGRSRIRNILKDKVNYPYILFMDCDALIDNKDFISNYIKEIENLENPESLICGGRNYRNERPSDSTTLHWVWGKKREAFGADERCKQPYQSFMTNNFIITKAVLDKIPFNESLSGYGHEDTLLGFELSKKNIPVIHIDNPVEHIGLEEADIILDKARQGITNLLKIYHITNKDPDFVKISKLLRAYEIVNKYRIKPLVKLLFSVFRKPIEKNLKSKSPGIRIFDLYKLGIICEL